MTTIFSLRTKVYWTWFAAMWLSLASFTSILLAYHYVARGMSVSTLIQFAVPFVIAITLVAACWGHDIAGRCERSDPDIRESYRTYMDLLSRGRYWLFYWSTPVGWVLWVFVGLWVLTRRTKEKEKEKEETPLGVC